MNTIKVIKAKRESNFELCRIICMVYIVFYHLFIHVDNHLDEEWFTKPLITISHIGVLVFVMISGYFGIKRRLDKFLYILSLIFFYNLIGLFIAMLIWGRQPVLSDFLRVFLPFSNGGYWFMKSYLVLYLLAPYVNHVLENLSIKQFKIFLTIFGFIVLYLGGFFSSSLGEGRGITAFVFSYSIGRYIRNYHSDIPFLRFPKMNAFLPYILVCLSFIVLYGLLPDKLSKVINHLFFGYNSVGLYFMSFLFFMAFKQLSFKSHFINSIATSVLAVYLIHECMFTRDALIYFPFKLYSAHISNSVFLLLFQLLFALIIVAICIGIDKIREKFYIVIRAEQFFLYCQRRFTKSTQIRKRI